MTILSAGLDCVVSVSVGLSAGLKHSALFGRAKIRASAKMLRKPQFSRRQKAKNGNAMNGLPTKDSPQHTNTRP